MRTSAYVCMHVCEFMSMFCADSCKCKDSRRFAGMGVRSTICRVQIYPGGQCDVQFDSDIAHKTKRTKCILCKWCAYLSSCEVMEE